MPLDYIQICISFKFEDSISKSKVERGVLFDEIINTAQHLAGLLEFKDLDMGEAGKQTDSFKGPLTAQSLFEKGTQTRGGVAHQRSGLVSQIVPK